MSAGGALGGQSAHLKCATWERGTQISRFKCAIWPPRHPQRTYFTLQEHIFINRLYIRRLHQNECYKVAGRASPAQTEPHPTYHRTTGRPPRAGPPDVTETTEYLSAPRRRSLTSKEGARETERAAHGRSLLNRFAALGEAGSWGAPVMVGRPSGEGRGVEAARCLGSSRCCC